MQKGVLLNIQLYILSVCKIKIQHCQHRMINVSMATGGLGSYIYGNDRFLLTCKDIIDIYSFYLRLFVNVLFI